jgi:hypothetical protein
MRSPAPVVIPLTAADNVNVDATAHWHFPLQRPYGRRT